eukprot:TRINITY_DN25690_c0_g1_i1.p1 TRINITY_DN25690_c0_g1~~TRINITY_DN25690_c0_g1_i1.p1  ORF type:complete len:368 (-),score=85.09 TRINITY_DN25690_c0_g1_i1:121-1224(-)
MKPARLPRKHDGTQKQELRGENILNTRIDTGPAVSPLAVLTSIVPLLVIGGLLYAAFFLKAGAAIQSVKPPAIERRDTFLGVAMPASTVIWAVGGNGKIVRSDDGGMVFSAQVGPVSVNLQAIAAWSAEQAIAAGNEGLVIRTDDGGKNWQLVPAPKSEIANKLLRLRAYDGGIAWAVGELGAVLKSSDYGHSWQRVLPEKDQAWNDIFFVGERGWLVGEFGQILISEDGGVQWRPVVSGIESSLMSVCFRDADNGVAVGLSGSVLSTRDGGASWTALKPQTREHLNDVIWDGTRWIAVGDKGVMVTGDSTAENWQATRISEGNLAWHTQIVALPPVTGQASGYILAGANLARFAGDSLTVFGRAAD